MAVLQKSKSQKLHPLLKAYLIGYVAIVGPKAVAVTQAVIVRKCDYREARSKMLTACRRALAYDRLPTFFGVTVGGSTLLVEPILKVLSYIARRRRTRNGIKAVTLERAARFIAAFLAATLGFALLNDQRRGTARRLQFEDADKRDEREADDQRPACNTQLIATNHTQPMSPQLAGKSIDLTLFSLANALTVLAPPLLSPFTPAVLAPLVAPALFAVSSGIIMRAWFFTPERLPSTYNDWITSAASLDSRLRTTLQRAHSGEFIYGKDTGQAHVLQSLARDLNLPAQWGDPAITVPIPCELVHSGTGPSCEHHAATRFAQAFRFASRIYFPLYLTIALNVLILARSPSSSSTGARRSSTAHRARAIFSTATRSAARSSLFLASFITLFYYGVCLTRTRIGPRLLPKHQHGRLDSGWSVAVGCALCGWSALIEDPRRQTELMLYVLPRAAAVGVPRVYDRRHLWKEHLAFATSAAVVLAAVQEQNGRLVRGWFGNVLAFVMKQ